MKVMKFGGTSVKDANRIREMARIVTAENLDAGLVVVCSAMKGVTDDLIFVAHAAANGDSSWNKRFEEIRTRHYTAIQELFGDKSAALQAEIEIELSELGELLQGVSLIKECSLRTQDLVMSFGERFNNRICAAYLSTLGYTATYVDARPLVLTDDTFGTGMVRFAETYSRISSHFSALWNGKPKNRIAFVTGFVAATEDGITTTLGRNGSDYTASIFGAALQADDIEIWTDVDGVLTVDPRIVEEAFVIPDLSVEEAMELSYFGAEVLHPYTMIPAVEKSIPLWIKNTMNPTVRGTRIAKDVPPSQHPVTGLAVIRDVALINIVGGGMIGERGMAAKIFSVLSQVGTNIIMISQASSEHSICVIVKRLEAIPAVARLREVFADAIKARQIQEVQLVEGLEIVSAIGANMRGTPGVSGRLFSALGNERINVLAIAQGSGEMNISCVIDGHERQKALRAVHRAFFPEAYK